MEQFTYEELNLVAIYNGGSREKTLSALQDMRQYLEAAEQELIILTDSTIGKLNKISDAEYEALDLFPDFDE